MLFPHAYFMGGEIHSLLATKGDSFQQHLYHLWFQMVRDRLRHWTNFLSSLGGSNVQPRLRTVVCLKTQGRVQVILDFLMLLVDGWGIWTSNFWGGFGVLTNPNWRHGVALCITILWMSNGVLISVYLDPQGENILT